MSCERWVSMTVSGLRSTMGTSTAAGRGGAITARSSRNSGVRSQSLGPSARPVRGSKIAGEGAAISPERARARNPASVKASAPASRGISMASTIAPCTRWWPTVDAATTAADALVFLGVRRKGGAGYAISAHGPRTPTYPGSAAPCLIHTAPGAHAPRRLHLVAGEEATALVGEADHRVGIVRFFEGFEGLKHRVGISGLGAQASAQTDADQFDTGWNAELLVILTAKTQTHTLGQHGSALQVPDLA